MASILRFPLLVSALSLVAFWLSAQIGAFFQKKRPIPEESMRHDLDLVGHSNNASPDRTVIFGADATAAEVASVIKLNSKDEEADHYELHGTETSFGRSKGTYTFPDDPYLSAIHARIKLRESDYFLEDLGSRNGTFARIRKRALAGDGDTLMIGKQLLRVLVTYA